ncbi:MAG: M4 family metallopeptidase [Bacteroidota bacterium]|nr:M4 family metallopeptidase [Bacteroidota bacterium]
MCNPLHCFLPPYMVEKLKKNVDPEMASVAKKNDKLSKKFRNSREYILYQRQEVNEVDDLKLEGSQIEIYDCNDTEELPGEPIVNGNQNEDYKNVSKNLKTACSFYQDLFARNSFNNNAAKIIASINYSNDYNNAHWNGGQLVFGNGDGVNFKSFTSDIDVVAHELTHGISPVSITLGYSGESGALVESFSDIMGILVKQKIENEDVKQSNWLMGENVLMDNGYAIRSLKDPGAAFVNHPTYGNDPQPKIYDKLITVNDVHKFCGIPNFAFYVAARDMGGNAWEKAGRIWYGAYMELKYKKTNFGMFRNATVDKAKELFPGGAEIQAVNNGWDEVKVIPFEPGGN